MPCSYVIGALLPRGGAFMAYHIGLMLEQRFGYQMVNVHYGRPLGRLQFDYELLPPTISLAEMVQRVADDDLIVVNPMFSNLMLGLRVPGRKICYVQDFRTFSVLDCKLDLYVSVSSVVKNFLDAVYKIESRVIPPFIRLDRMPNAIPWRQRPPGSSVMYLKDGTENRLVADYLLRSLETAVPRLAIQTITSQEHSHFKFLERIAGVRYLINVSLAEGFGLVPLEAMALGTCITGLDAFSGRDYMERSKNSMTASFREVDVLPKLISSLVANENLSEQISRQGIADAQRYSFGNFVEAWSDVVDVFLKV